MKIIHTFVTPKVSNEKQKLLDDHLFHENIQRCKLFAKIVIIFEALLILKNLSSRHVPDHGQLEFSLNTYIVLYLLLLGISAGMLLLIHRYETSDFHTDRQLKLLQFGLYSFFTFFMVWGAVVTLVDQKEYGHVMAFVINFMCISILFYASNKSILKMYILPIAVLVIGLPFYQPSKSILMGHYINLLVFFFFCWVASRMLYSSNATNFLNKLLLKETNHRLAAKITENEKINLEMAMVNEQLKKIAIMDELTKIPNRRGFQQYIQEMLIYNNQKRNVSIMMLDIDAFKLFNDHYGHLEGDKVLTAVAQTIQICIQSTSSFIARFGGEEFVIALFDFDSSETERLAKTIQEAIMELNIPHEYSPVSHHLTISIGLVTGQVTNEKEIEQLMEKADNALYQAKSKGRNRVEYDGMLGNRVLTRKAFIKHK
ncbi:GGDEF domain-containing protein [Heyndrickxia vini]|uniref:GGDEF domain-containing protein n=1 Tax=Heyndrickxia vini TaxID=1476025 RepID=A0ABX7E5T2_9BACI|nr:GGDEF domain-containing protein [Heyndrickxia vini]QQZ10137.1 GGDEF domain-containing protein [Heyndrickxia vini]